MSDDWSISASKLKTYSACGRRFELRYLDGHDPMGTENKYLRRGNAVHETIEDGLNSSGASVTSDELVSLYLERGGKSGYNLSDEFHGQVLSSLKTAAEFLHANVDSVRGVEERFEVGHKTLSRGLSGFIDLTTPKQVVDWKTGKSEDKGSDEALQGAVYMAGYYHLYDEAPEDIRFVYLNPEPEGNPCVSRYKPGDELWNNAMQVAHELTNRVENDTIQADPGPSKCHWCDFEVYCPDSPVGAGAIDWETYP